MNTVIKTPFSKNIKDIYQYGLNNAKDYKGKFSGDLTSGTFDFDSYVGRFAGNYIVQGNFIIFTFTKKPFLIPKMIIENFLKSHIE